MKSSLLIIVWTVLSFSGIISLKACLWRFPCWMMKFMKTELQEKYIMKRKTQRDVLSWRAFLNRVAKCAPPNYHEHLCSSDQNVRMSLCALRGGLTIEASFVLPFFLMILFRAACVPEFGGYSVKNAEGAGHCLLILQKASPNAHREINSPPHAIPIYRHPA